MKLSVIRDKITHAETKHILSRTEGDKNALFLRVKYACERVHVPSE